MRDRALRHTTRISVSAQAGQTTRPSGYWTAPSLAKNSEWIVFSSLDSFLDRGDTNITWDVFAARFPYLRGLGIVREARTEIGMPYCPRPEPDFRGCPREDSLLGCGGPYFGFRCGVCTDLVMDAYREGSSYDLGIALMVDLIYHPDRQYRWNDARSANDMWLYFQYTGEIFRQEDEFMPGDVAFFDWEQDGVIDHTGIVTKVDGEGRPLAIIEALGTIESNPDGLARELNWQGYHTQAYTGHAR